MWEKLVIKAREPGVCGSLIRFGHLFVQWGLLSQLAVLHGQHVAWFWALERKGGKQEKE